MLIWRGCLMAINRVAVAPARHSDLSCLVLPLALAVLVLAGLLRRHTVVDSAPRAVYEASPSAAENDSAPRHSQATRPILKVLN
jgi:hypothetical protein